MPQVERSTSQVNLQRAIIVGLGGSGAEVVRRLRRLIIDRFGSFEALPIVKFLYIDTDPDWIRAVTTEVEEDIRLPEAELVDAQVPDATDLYQGIERGNYPNYRWFTLERLKTFTNVTKGAGTIRQLGRLCFWQRQNIIEKKFRALVNDLNGNQHATYMQTHYGQQIDPGINVHIVAGLAGGTGSGCFLDMAYLARDVIGRLEINGAHQYAGYLILPAAFADLPGTNALPNGFAALKELNYLNYRHSPDNPLAPLFGHPEWLAEYTPGNGNPVQFVNQAPFDFCYLLDSSNQSVQLHRNDIFAMLARSLFHEFTLEFASFKRSLRANIRNRITSNDLLDCPAQFMSFGQSAVYFPLREVKEALAHQLALRAVQQWVDRTAKPIEVLGLPESTLSTDQAADQVMSSLSKVAGSEDVTGAVRTHIVQEFVPNKGFRARDVLTAVIADERTRLTDVPYQLRETEKQRWINENWPRDSFEGHLSDAWTRWKRDFSDDGPDPTAWGEQIRWMVGNRDRSLKRYRQVLYDHALEMFHDPARGPAQALSFIRQMTGPLDTLSKRFLSEANDAVAIANALGDIYLINAASKTTGPSLSAIIERRIGEEYQELDEVVRENWAKYLWGGDERLRSQAYEYLTWCAHYCRARVEERARRLASEMCASLQHSLGDIEKKLSETARTLAAIQARMTQLARQWAQKGATTENVGKLLYDPVIVEALERKIAELRGDVYDPKAVAEKSLSLLGISLDQIKESDLQRLQEALMSVASEAIGDITEPNLTDTRFAAYDLLSAQCADQKELDSTVANAVAVGAPYVKLVAQPPEGVWGDLLETRGAGIRGGCQQNDQDRERVRFLQALQRQGWNPANEVKAISDSEQIVFVQECGGFPLRALAGIHEMRKAYENHRTRKQNPPLHIVRDEMSERFPDIFPPSSREMERALLLQSVGLALDLIVPSDFQNPDGSGHPLRLYAYQRCIPETHEVEAVKLGDTPAAVGMKLAYDDNLAKEIESGLDARIRNADSTLKTAMAAKLKAYLEQRKAQAREEEPTLPPDTNPVYTTERDRLVKFMREKGLV